VGRLLPGDRGADDHPRVRHAARGHRPLLAIDTYRWARTDEADATRELARAAVDFADRVRRAQAPLLHAASTLHGRVQGRCVIFAARVDENPPTADDIAQFRVETDRALDEVLVPVPTSEIETVGALRRMLAGWEPIMVLETRIDDAAASAVDGAEAAPIVSEVVNEALVNAVKHSGARAARIDISTDAGETSTCASHRPVSCLARSCPCGPSRDERSSIRTGRGRARVDPAGDPDRRPA
jgi:hypothetical protein